MSGRRSLPQSTLVILVVAAALLALTNVTTVVVHRRVRPLPDELMRVSSLNMETSVGTWFTLVLLAVAGALALLAAWAAGPGAERRGWAAAAGLLLLLSLDDKIQLHERLPEYFGVERGSLATHDWLLPGVILLLIALIAVTVLARGLPRQAQWGLLLATVVFFAGAVGVEGVSGFVNRSAETETSLLRKTVFALMILEETLEMLGASISVSTVLGHLSRAGWLRPAVSPSST